MPLRHTYPAPLSATALLLAASFGAAPSWSQAGPEPCNTVVDGNGEPVADAGGQRVLTVGSAPCPRAEPQVVAAVPEPQPAPAAGPIFTVAGDVVFDFDSARIRPEFHPTLDEIAAALRQIPGQRLALTGHTDAIGPEPYNEELALRRARAVAAYLQRAGGVPPARMAVSGIGEGQPIAPNDTEAGRAQNRRVEITAI
jgi:outer membrane protein OmpA-like peptidoglycan-associated protein